MNEPHKFRRCNVCDDSTADHCVQLGTGNNSNDLLFNTYKGMCMEQNLAIPYKGSNGKNEWLTLDTGSEVSGFKMDSDECQNRNLSFSKEANYGSEVGVEEYKDGKSRKLLSVELQPYCSKFRKLTSDALIGMNMYNTDSVVQDERDLKATIMNQVEKEDRVFTMNKDASYACFGRECSTEGFSNIKKVPLTKGQVQIYPAVVENGMKKIFDTGSTVSQYVPDMQACLVGLADMQKLRVDYNKNEVQVEYSHKGLDRVNKMCGIAPHPSFDSTLESIFG